MSELAEVIENRANIIYITQSRKKAKNISSYTSRGVKKAQSSDSIKSLEDIRKLGEYLLSANSKYRYRNYAMFYVGISLGLRISDIRRLKLSHFQHPDGSYRERLVITEKKTSKQNYPKINRTVRDAVDLYLAHTDDIGYDTPLFLSRKGKGVEAIKTSQIYRILNGASEKLGLPYHIGTHSLRKTFAYWIIHNNKDNPNVLIALQKMLNHSDMRTTMIYAGIMQEETDQLYDSLETIF